MKHSQFKFLFLSSAVIALIGIAWFLQAYSGSTAFIWNISRGGTWMLPLVSVAALIDSINPCAFSILLLTIAFLFSLGKAHTDILKIGGTYVAGLFVVYLLIGLGLLQAFHIFNTPHFMAKVGAWLLVALGAINVIGYYFPRFPIKIKIPDIFHAKMAQFIESASLPTAFLLGVLVGLCEFPCTGGPYLMILGLLHDQGTYLAGFGYLVLYNIIFVLPLIVILFLASNSVLHETVSRWRSKNVGAMHLYGGIAAVVLGILILML